MANEISYLLAENKPAIYIFGSVALDDFKPGWSDIDILVLTTDELAEQQADILLELRQDMQKRYPDNPYFCLFEGGILSVDAFLGGKNERAVYWGTSGHRITGNYKIDSFGMAELLNCGILLCGTDIHEAMNYPTYAQMRDDIARYVQAARVHGGSVGWLLDIARGIYTLRTGEIIAKTAAGEWALENGLCPDSNAMYKTIQIRKEPIKYTKEDREDIDNSVIQKFADVIDAEFVNTAQHFAESELRRMNIQSTGLSPIQNKDGVAVFRVTANDISYVMKCFDKQEHRREIENYQALISLGIPTLKVISHTDCSILLEDIEQSAFRLATADDMNDPNIARLLANWYKALHENGREYANTRQLYDECDCLTFENMTNIKNKTGTGDLQIWKIIEENLDKIRSAAINLPRTLTYNDFYYTNFVVAHDATSALMFDYNMLGKGYVYADIRNVYSSLGEEAGAAFLSAYGSYDENEVIVDNVVCDLQALHVACQRETFPDWALESLDSFKDGKLQTAVEKLLSE